MWGAFVKIFPVSAVVRVLHQLGWTNPVEADPIVRTSNRYGPSLGEIRFWSISLEEAWALCKIST
jgi:hypothetical protein